MRPALALALLAVAAGCGGAGAAATTAAPAATPAEIAAIPHFRHVLVVVFENREATEVGGSRGGKIAVVVKDSAGNVSWEAQDAPPAAPSH